MKEIDPRLLILVGFILLLIGFIIPFLNVMGILQASFFLSFAGYTASFLGSVMGMAGAVWYFSRSKDN
jgi:hypothetical protein